MTLPERPPDWRTRLGAQVRRAVVRPMTSGAKRAFVTLLAISFAVGGANLLFTARQVSDTRAALAASVRAAASVTQLCQLGNESRAQQVVLWEHIITISRPPPHETPAQERRRLATVRAFGAYLHEVFAPRDCRALHH